MVVILVFEMALLVFILVWPLVTIPRLQVVYLLQWVTMHRLRMRPPWLLVQLLCLVVLTPWLWCANLQRRGISLQLLVRPLGQMQKVVLLWVTLLQQKVSNLLRLVRLKLLLFQVVQVLVLHQVLNIMQLVIQ